MEEKWQFEYIAQPNDGGDFKLAEALLPIASTVVMEGPSLLGIGSIHTG